MANEAQLLTINAAGTSWVDVVPGAVSTGYQAQNTNIEAGRVGVDATHVTASGGDAILQISGPVDVNGLAYKITSAVTLTPGSDGTWYIKLAAGTGGNLTPTLQAGTGTWDAGKNALYDSGERVLNWRVVRSGGAVAVNRIIEDLADQPVRTTDQVVFDRIFCGFIDTKGVGTVLRGGVTFPDGINSAGTFGGNVTFTGTTVTVNGLSAGGVSLTGILNPRTDPTSGSQSIAGSSTYTPPRSWRNAQPLTANTNIEPSGGPFSGSVSVRNASAGAITWSFYTY